MKFVIKKISGTIKVVTGLHIGVGNTEMHIGGTDNPVIKNVLTGEPYIPGSSLKGKMRNLLRLYTGGDDAHHLVTKLFGAGAGDEGADNREKGITLLSFWDCFITDAWRQKLADEQIPYTEIKMENTIDRQTGAAKNPRNTERILPGTEFDFNLSLKVFDEKDLLPVVLGTMKLLEADSLGGSGSRGYGKIEFENLTVDGKDIQKEFAAIQPFEDPFTADFEKTDAAEEKNEDI